MGYLEEVIGAANAGTNAKEPEGVQTPTEKAGPQPGAPEGEQAQNGGGTETTELGDSPKAGTQKKDVSGFTKEEKAQHAFRRQLEKQRGKYESQIREMHDTFQKQLEEFKREIQASKPKEQPKQRKDFDTDDDYIRYLVQTQSDALKKDNDEKSAKDRAEREAREKEEEESRLQQQEVAGLFQRNCRAAFADEKAYGEFAERVNRGIANGLGEILDNAPAIRDYIFTNQNGPAVLNRMLSDRSSFVRVMRNAGSPMAAVLEMHDMAREIAQGGSQQTRQMPKIGKPGARPGDARTGIGSSDRELIRFIRGRR